MARRWHLLERPIMRPKVVLYGAAGHTGGFIAAEMARRGWDSVLAGRDMSKLASVAAVHGAQAKQADVDRSEELRALLRGADAVINAAGPFGDTAPQLIDAAIGAEIPYFDVTAEPFVARDIFEAHSERARRAATVVAPAFGFFGALGDLLVTAAMAEWESADSIELAFALDRWRPTRGTRLAGARRAGRRLVLAGGSLEAREPAQAVPKGTWRFDEPFGEQPTIGEFSTVDVVTISRHIDVDRIATWINEAPIADLVSADQSGPTAADESGRSAQQFRIEAVVHRGSEQRRASATGRDIYAITAPIICEAVSWTLQRRAKTTGVLAPGELFEAESFLAALSPTHLSTQVPSSTR